MAGYDEDFWGEDFLEGEEGATEGEEGAAADVDDEGAEGAEGVVADVDLEGWVRRRMRTTCYLFPKRSKEN